jgi:hypothetical protein
METWGSSAWNFLHAISFAYPENPSITQQNETLSFFNSLQRILPCETCRRHYSELLVNNPPDVSSMTSLSNWLINVHNEINKKLKKREYTYAEVSVKYLKKKSCKFKSSSKRACSTTLWVVLSLTLCVVISTVLILYFRSKSKAQ